MITHFDNIGFINSKFSDEQLLPVRKEIEKIQNNFTSAVSVNNTLIGNIKKEFRLNECKSHIQDLITPLINEFLINHPDYLGSVSVLTNELPCVLDDPWVNFQEKHEFNPPHNHTGIFSFVIWIKIPYSFEEEKKQFYKTLDRNISPGCFCFQYVNILGQIESYIIPADKTYENCVMVFPSKMMHSVNPFYTSDDYRISVSGNFKFKS